MEPRDSDHRYLLSIRRGTDAASVLSATLRDVSDGNLTSFRDLSELVAFLTSPSSEASGTSSGAETPTVEEGES